MDKKFFLIHNYEEVPGMILSVEPESQVSLHNKWAKYCYMPININTVTFKMYNYQTDYRGYIVYAGTKQECFERLSLFHILNKYYTIPLADIEFE